MVLQLDQLRAAEGSPVRRTVEHHQRLAARAIGVEVTNDSVLIWEREIRDPIANRWSSREIIRSRTPAAGDARGLRRPNAEGVVQRSLRQILVGRPQSFLSVFVVLHIIHPLLHRRTSLPVRTALFNNSTEECSHFTTRNRNRNSHLPYFSSIPELNWYD